MLALKVQRKSKKLDNVSDALFRDDKERRTWVGVGEAPVGASVPDRELDGLIDFISLVIDKPIFIETKPCLEEFCFE